MRRTLSVLLALFIVFGFLPAQVFAEETGETAETFENDDDYYYTTIICHAEGGVFDPGKISEGDVSEDKTTLTYTGKVLYENIAAEEDDPYYESFLINMPPKKGISRKGYKFTGWYVNDEVEGEFDGMPGVEKYGDEVHLYARWKKTFKKGWEKTKDGWVYRLSETESYKNGIYTIGGKKYGFDKNGIMVIGWRKFSGKWHYFKSSGVMVRGWQKISGKWYWFDANGIMITGWKKISGKWYYFASSGIMTTGWKKLSGKWYYFQSSGVMKTGWLKLSGKWYYFKSSGVMATGTLKIGSKTYKFSSSGVCLNP